MGDRWTGRMTNRAFTSPAVWLAFALHTLIVVVAAWFLSGSLPPHEPTGYVNPSLAGAPSLLAPFLQWDAHWYTAIAERGYTVPSIAFFPLTAVLIRGVAAFGLSYAAAGLLVGNVFAFFSFALLHEVLRLDCPESQTRWALLTYAVMPTSFFLNTIYTEPLFMVFGLGCVYHARLGQWGTAGRYAALATLTRHVGIALVLFLAWELWNRERRPWRPAVLAAALLPAPLALLVFMGYCSWLTGDPLAFAHAQGLWARTFSLPWVSFWDNTQLLLAGRPYPAPGIILDSFTVLGAVVVLTLQTFWKRVTIRRSYLALGWVWLLIPLCASSPRAPLMSMSRFILVVFPLYFVGTHVPPRYLAGYLAASALLLALGTALFVNGYWMG